MDDHGARLKMLQSGFGQKESRVNVGFHRRVEIFVRDIFQRRLGLLASRIVDENIETTQRGHSIFNKLLAKLFVAEVAWKSDSCVRLSQ